MKLYTAICRPNWSLLALRIASGLKKVLSSLSVMVGNMQYVVFPSIDRLHPKQHVLKCELTTARNRFERPRGASGIHLYTCGVFGLRG